MSLAWQVGWCIAALAGGYLSHPERRFSALRESEFLRQNPYALPTFTMAIAPLLSVALGFFVLKETLEPSSKDKNLATTRKITWTNTMWAGLRIFATLCTVNIAFQACLPLFFYAPVEAGGLGLPTSAIGQTRVSIVAAQLF